MGRQNKEGFMRRAAAVAVLLVVALAGRGLAQQGGLADCRSKSPISPEDRQKIASWLAGQCKKLVAPTEGDYTAMVTARAAILFDGHREASWSKDYIQAYGEEAIKALLATEQQSLGPEARLNVVMTLADLKRLEGIPMLEKVLTGDPYPATRYCAAKGLSGVAELVLQEGKVREQQDMTKAVASALQNESDPFVLLHLFDILTRFDHDGAHDALAEGATKAVLRLNARDPVGVQVLMLIVKGLEKAYTGDVRPEAKTRLLSAFAALCADIMPPVSDPTLMPALNATLVKITGEEVGFQPTETPVMQKLALMEWVEKLFKAKKIPSRPALPPAVEQMFKESAAPEPAPKAPEPAPKKGTEPAAKAPETTPKKGTEPAPKEPAPKKAAEPAPATPPKKAAEPPAKAEGAGPAPK
jgi:hypothetical protein